MTVEKAPSVLLLFPPQAQPFLPHPALPALAAVLRREGVKVVQRDLNLEAYEHFLSAPVLASLGMDAAGTDRVEAALKALRCGKEHFDLADYFAGVRTIREALRRVSGQQDGLDWDLKHYRLRGYDPSSWDAIHEATFDRRGHLLLDWMESLLPGLAQEKPDLVGISVAWDDQLICAFTLARLIKKHLPSTHVCMGGSMITHLADCFTAGGERRKRFSAVDSFLPFEGEQSLPRLVRALPGRRLADVPGLIYLAGKKVMSNPPSPGLDLADLPAPDFDGLPLDRYYSPRVYLPVSGSRGCYWARCAFCSHHFSGNRFRRRDAAAVLAELDALHERYACQDFYFSDDSLPPALASSLAQAIAESGRPYRWAAELRLEDRMDGAWFDGLYAGGCRLILFGLESNCQRILDLMEKGVRKETAGPVIQAASESGIITWVFYFLGFPGETEPEARETLEFLVQHRQHIDMVAGGPFVLARNSAVHLHPERFGVAPVQGNPARELQLAFRHTLSGGVTWDVPRLLSEFRTRRETMKFLRSFVAEPHLLFFPKAHFRDTSPFA